MIEYVVTHSAGWSSITVCERAGWAQVVTHDGLIESLSADSALGVVKWARLQERKGYRVYVVKGAYQE